MIMSHMATGNIKMDDDDHSSSKNNSRYKNRGVQKS